MKQILRLAASFVTATAITLAAALPAPNPLRGLDRFVGTWTSSGTFSATPYSKAGTANGLTTCSWSLYRDFLICQQRVILNGAVQHDLAIYTYDPLKHAYKFYNIGRSQANETNISVTPTTIVYTDSFVDHGNAVTIHTLNVWNSSDRYDHYTFRTEFSKNGGKTWTRMLSGTARRLNPRP
jgi:hypothetical protein